MPDIPSSRDILESLKPFNAEPEDILSRGCPGDVKRAVKTLKSLGELAEVIGLDLIGASLIGDHEGVQRRMTDYSKRDGYVVPRLYLHHKMVYGEDRGGRIYEAGVAGYPVIVLWASSFHWARKWLAGMGVIGYNDVGDYAKAIFELALQHSIRYLTPERMEPLHRRLMDRLEPEEGEDQARSLSFREHAEFMERKLKMFDVDRLYINTYKQARKTCKHYCLEPLNCMLVALLLQASALYSAFTHITYTGSYSNIEEAAYYVGAYTFPLNTMLIGLLPNGGLRIMYAGLSTVELIGRIAAIQESVASILMEKFETLGRNVAVVIG
ncbi:MAG: hypothetical protein F7C35_03465 [Desulfurococcales archaeon]|nr:hypothetical protein [Desulfurococcales archaeon]